MESAMNDVMKSENAMNDILKSVEVRGRLERLIRLTEEKRQHYLGVFEREDRKERNYPLNRIRPMENACKADRLKQLLVILYNDGIEGYSNTDEQILEWLYDYVK